MTQVEIILKLEAIQKSAQELADLLAGLICEARAGVNKVPPPPDATVPTA